MVYVGIRMQTHSDTEGNYSCIEWTKHNHDSSIMTVVSIKREIHILWTNKQNKLEASRK